MNPEDIESPEIRRRIVRRETCKVQLDEAKRNYQKAWEVYHFWAKELDWITNELKGNKEFEFMENAE